MKIKGRFRNTSFEFLEAPPKDLNDFVEDNELYNKSNLLFLEDKYINECNRFSKIVDKFKVKKFDEKTFIFENNELKKLGDFSEEVKRFNKIILNNNINGLQKNDLSISVNHFEKYEKSEKIKFVQSIYILLFLSNFTEYYNNKFIFKVKIGDKEVVEQVYFNKIKIFNLFKIYSWIIHSKENLLTRLKIIREFIVRKGSFDLSEKDLSSAKSAFNRIIREETDKYFAQVNMLKDDFLKLSERKRENYQSLHLKFLGWLSSIALFIYSEVKDMPSDNLYKKIFYSKTEKSFLFLVIFVVSLIIIWLLFIKEIDENKKEYEKIKIFYTEQLFFDKDDFENFIDYPKIPCIYICIFSFFLFILCLRFLSFIL